MKKVAILYIALGRYITFWKDFYESCEKHLGPCEKQYFVWTDNETFEHSDAENVTITPAHKKGCHTIHCCDLKCFCNAKKN